MQALATSATPGRMNAKGIAIALVVLLLGAFVIYALQRDLRKAPASAGAPSAASQFSAGLGRDAATALSPQEEAFATALWPIHSETKLAAVRVIFAGLKYKTEHHDAARLATAIRPLVDSFKDLSVRAARLDAPDSLDQAHKSYLRALDLYGSAAQEMLKVESDGRDEHLIVAQQRSEEASAELLKLSDVLWPGEYKPN